jgi:4-hydroxy-tetrahydrodipicolinate reductase
VKVAFNGRGGKVGSVLAPALETAGHELVDLEQAEVMVDFTAPEAVVGNVRAALERGIPCVVGTTGWEPESFDGLAREHGVQLLYVPNFALGAVLMMRFAAEAGRTMRAAEIIELHNERKKDAPSGTAKATAGLLGGAPIHSVRLPGLVGHQEVLFGDEGQLLTIRFDAFSSQAYVPGVLLALERVLALSPGVTVGLETLLD